MTMPKSPLLPNADNFRLQGYSLVPNSPGDDAGISSSGTPSSLTDATKYWAPGIWQGALLIVSINNQNYTTIITSNTENRLIFPSLASGMKIGQNAYIVKRLPPSLTRPGLNLTATQQLVQLGYVATDIVNFPYPTPWVFPVIHPGVANGVSPVTLPLGTPSPYIVPVGYSFTVVEASWNFDQLSEMWLFFDGLLVASTGITQAGNPQHPSKIVGYSTTLVDPLAQNSHSIGYLIVNMGLSNMKGGFETSSILEQVPH